MYFIIPDICNQNGCFILVTLQWFKYSANPNGSTLYTEKSQPSILKSHKRSKMIETHFYRLYSIMTHSKIIAGSPSKKWHLILKLLQVFIAIL